MKRLLLILSVCFFAGCSGEGVVQALLENDVPGIRVKGDEVMTYNERSMQLSFNADNAEFRMFTDNMSDYLYVQLEKLPQSANQTVVVNKLIASSEDDVLIKNNAVFDVLKIEDGVIWMLDRKTNIGLVLRELE